MQTEKMTPGQARFFRDLKMNFFQTVMNSGDIEDHEEAAVILQYIVECACVTVYGADQKKWDSMPDELIAVISKHIRIKHATGGKGI